MQPKKIYIAGKVTGVPRHIATARFGTAEKVLLDEGNEPVNPLNIVDHHNDNWQQAMRKCITALMQCDEAHFLPCWRESTGANLERDICLRLGIPVVML